MTVVNNIFEFGRSACTFLDREHNYRSIFTDIKLRNRFDCLKVEEFIIGASLFRRNPLLLLLVAHVLVNLHFCVVSCSVALNHYIYVFAY
jgi:hypothetical protein